MDNEIQDTPSDEKLAEAVTYVETKQQVQPVPEAPKPDLVAKRDQLMAALQEHRQAARDLLERQQGIQQHICRLEGAVVVLNEVLGAQPEASGA